MAASPDPSSAVTDHQDLVNHLLAAAMQTSNAIVVTRRLLPHATDGDEVAADLTETIAALARSRDNLLHAADIVAGSAPHPPPSAPRRPSAAPEESR